MIFAYIVVGGTAWFFLQKFIIKISPKSGWHIFISVYLILSVILAYYLAGFSTKFALWQRIIALLVFIVSTVIRVLYYRGRFLPDAK